MGTHQMTSVTFCAYCGAGMLHVEAETCSSFCRSMLAVRRASMVSSAEILARAERAVPPADAMFSIARDDGLTSDFYFGTDIPIPRGVPTYELDQPEQYDRAPTVIVWTMGGVFVAIGILLIWAFS